MRTCGFTLTVKSVDDAERVIEGIATTPKPDRVGDIIDPMGAEFELPLPLLWQHDRTQPIGHVVGATVAPDGIQIKAKLASIDEPGPLKTRLDVYRTQTAPLIAFYGKKGLLKSVDGMAPIDTVTGAIDRALSPEIVARGG